MIQSSIVRLEGQVEGIARSGTVPLCCARRPYEDPATDERKFPRAWREWWDEIFKDCEDHNSVDCFSPGECTVWFVWSLVYRCKLTRIGSITSCKQGFSAFARSLLFKIALPPLLRVRQTSNSSCCRTRWQGQRFCGTGREWRVVAHFAERGYWKICDASFPGAILKVSYYVSPQHHNHPIGRVVDDFFWKLLHQTWLTNRLSRSHSLECDTLSLTLQLHPMDEVRNSRGGEFLTPVEGSINGPTIESRSKLCERCSQLVGRKASKTRITQSVNKSLLQQEASEQGIAMVSIP